MCDFVNYTMYSRVLKTGIDLLMDFGCLTVVIALFIQIAFNKHQQVIYVAGFINMYMIILKLDFHSDTATFYWWIFPFKFINIYPLLRVLKIVGNYSSSSHFKFNSKAIHFGINSTLKTTFFLFIDQFTKLRSTYLEIAFPIIFIDLVFNC